MKIANILNKLRGRFSTEVHPNGSDLIGAQPWRGNLAYLHVLHPPLVKEGLAELEALYGWTFPEEIRSFYKITNGMELYEASLNLFGHLSHFTRDPSARNPFSPDIAVSTFSSAHAVWHAKGYLPVGSLVLHSLSSFIIADPSARIAVIRKDTSEAIRDYQDFGTAIESLLVELTPFWDMSGRRVEPRQQIDCLGVMPGKS